MGYVKKTISYWKRNGIANTVSAVLERVDRFGMDAEQKKANAYSGRTTKVRRDALEEEKICFSLVVPAYETKEVFLRQLMDSVLGQTYHNLQLVIADSSSTNQVKDIVDTYDDSRILYHRLSKNGGISDNTNEGILMAGGDYIGLLDHDDVLEVDALYHIAEKLRTQDFDMVYTDEDKMSCDGARFFEPNLKPEFNLDYLLTNNYICHFTVIRASIMKELLFRKKYDGAQDYDLFLRVAAWIDRQRIIRMQEKNVEKAPDRAIEHFEPSYMKTKIGHIPEVLYHWRAHEQSTADNPESKRYAYEAGKRCLEDFLRQMKWHAAVRHSKHLGFYEICYLPTIFAVRRDVAAIGTYQTVLGRIRKGPKLDGRECFRGMNEKYSGYLHRAHLTFDADELPQETRVENPSAAAGGKLLYLPTRQYRYYTAKHSHKKEK